MGKPEFHLDQEIAKANRAYVVSLHTGFSPDFTIAPHGERFAILSNTTEGDEFAHEFWIGYSALVKAVPIGGGWYSVSAADLDELTYTMATQGMVWERK